MSTINVMTSMIIVICLVGTHQVSTHCHVLLSVTVTHPSMNQCVELMDSPMPLPVMLAVQSGT